MAGETIIIADDKPVSLRLTSTFLVNQGYNVVSAASADQAVELASRQLPDLVYADLESADWDSLELARRIKQNERTRHVLALAAAPAGDEAKAREAGCDGYVARPVEISNLGLCIRQTLDLRAPAGAAHVARNGGPKDAAAQNDDRHKQAAVELDAVRTRFLAEGSEKTRELLNRLNLRFDINDASKAVHQWIGTGGLLGFTAISLLAREAEHILKEQPLDAAQLRETLEQLAVAFATPGEAREEPLPPSIVEALAGKRIAAVEFTGQQQERLRAAFNRVGAEAVFLHATDASDAGESLSADIILVHVTSQTAATRWLNAAGPLGGSRPVVLAGMREDLAALPPAVQALAREFLMDSWQPEETLVRLSLATAHRPSGRSSAGLGAGVGSGLNRGARTQVVIADDDPAVLFLVRNTLENFGMDCHQADNGADAIETIRRMRPHAAVLDVNMPGMDGYQVLTAVRHEDLPVRVLLLTARQQESDVIRGFTLGADDYVVKPFSPMELVARLKRLLYR